MTAQTTTTAAFLQEARARLLEAVLRGRLNAAEARAILLGVARHTEVVAGARSP